MKKIAFYISDHGLGHTTRSIAIIRELIKYDDLEITIKTSKPLNFMKKSLNLYSNIDFIKSDNDVGLILKNNSFEVDRETMQLQVRGWVNNWHELIMNEASFLDNNNFDLVISDITPWIFPAADKVGVKSIAISNFTWYDQYKELLDRDRSVETVGDAYKKVDLFLRYPFNLGLEKARDYEEIGFLSRKSNQEKINYIKANIENNNRKIVFVGIGKSLNSDILNNINFKEYDNYFWLFTAGVDIKGGNIYNIPENELEIQNYIAASDYVITKPGWSTVSEALLASVPMLLINLTEIPETRKIIKDIKKMKAGLSLDLDDFYNLNNIESKFSQLDKLDMKTNKYKNTVDTVAKRIYNYI